MDWYAAAQQKWGMLPAGETDEPPPDAPITPADPPELDPEDPSGTGWRAIERRGGKIAPDLLAEEGLWPGLLPPPGPRDPTERHALDISPGQLQAWGLLGLVPPASRSKELTNPPSRIASGGPFGADVSREPRMRDQLADYLLRLGIPRQIADVYRTATLQPLTATPALGEKRPGVAWFEAPNTLAISTGPQHPRDYTAMLLEEAAHAVDWQANQLSQNSAFRDTVERVFAEQPDFARKVALIDGRTRLLGTQGASGGKSGALAMGPGRDYAHVYTAILHGLLTNQSPLRVGQKAIDRRLRFQDIPAELKPYYQQFAETSPLIQKHNVEFGPQLPGDLIVPAEPPVVAGAS